MDSLGEKSFGLEVWRSQLSPSVKIEKYIIIAILIFTLLIPLFLFLLLINIINIEASLFIFLALQVTLSLILSPLIILSIRYFLSHIIIHEKGVIVREKSFFKLWKKRYIKYEEIEGIDIGNTYTWKANGAKIFIKKIVIQVKDKDSHQISNSWVNDVNYLRELLTHYKDKFSS